MICVDTPMKYGLRTWCHLFDDHHDVNALHAFAERIGLKRCWFQKSRAGVPHYDLTGSKIGAARKAGAKLMDRENVVAAIKRLKEADRGDTD